MDACVYEEGAFDQDANPYYSCCVIFQSRDVREQLARAYNRMGLLGAALKQREAVRQLFPQDAAALVACGLAYEAAGQAADATACFEQAGASVNGSAAANEGARAALFRVAHFCRAARQVYRLNSSYWTRIVSASHY